MAGELQAHATTGQTLYAVLLSAIGQAWNGSVFEALDAGSWTDYDIAITESAIAGIYLGTMPAAAAGVYTYVVYARAGASPAVTDSAVGYGWLAWDGSAVIIPASAAELAKVPKSDSNVSWNATALAAINAEVDTALNTAIPGSPTADSINQRIAAIDDLTPAVAISATTAASVSTGALAVRTHHSLSQAISSTYAGNLNAATKLWLAVKAEKDDTDAQSVIFIEKTAGLTVLAGAAYTTVAHGSLTIGGLAGAWTVTVALDEVATGLLTPYADGMLWAECKALVAGSTVAVWDGVCDVARGIVVAVS